MCIQSSVPTSHKKFIYYAKIKVFHLEDLTSWIPVKVVDTVQKNLGYTLFVYQLIFHQGLPKNIINLNGSCEDLSGSHSMNQTKICIKHKYFDNKQFFLRIKSKKHNIQMNKRNITPFLSLFRLHLFCNYGTFEFPISTIFFSLSNLGFICNKYQKAWTGRWLLWQQFLLVQQTCDSSSVQPTPQKLFVNI